MNKIIKKYLIVCEDEGNCIRNDFTVETTPTTSDEKAKDFIMAELEGEKVCMIFEMLTDLFLKDIPEDDVIKHIKLIYYHEDRVEKMKVYDKEAS